MRSGWAWSSWLGVVLVASGCTSGDGSGSDAGVDAATQVDAAEADAGVADGGAEDAGLSSDAGLPDTGPDAARVGPEPIVACPGAPSCAPGGDPQLMAGAARLTITPEGFETYNDADGDRVYDVEEETFNDADGDGEFDVAWIAGFGNARAAQGVMNDQWARALALRAGNVTLALVSVDLVGWFLDDIDRVRQTLASEGLDVDYVVVSATHVHQARDTIGLWGQTISDTGVSPEYQAYVRERIAGAVRAAVADLRPAHIQYASALLRDMDNPSNVNRYVGDNRDPIIIDDQIRILRFVRADDDTTTISTLVNFGAHPEYQGSSNPLLSSDYAHWMRRAIEGGIPIADAPHPRDPDQSRTALVPAGPDGQPVAGIGGVTVFINGAIGSQIGPNHLSVRDWNDNRYPEDSDQSSEVVGTQLGYFVLQAIRGPASRIEDTAEISFRYRRFMVVVENRSYHIAGTLNVFVRELFNYDSTRPITPTQNLPEVRTEVALIRIGDAWMLSVPGELDPGEWLGGYDDGCPWTPGGCDLLIDEQDENPPDLTMAPAGPFLRDRLLELVPMADRDQSQLWILGLTNDFLGYFIPEFDFELFGGSLGAYIFEAPGDHYEETRAIGVEGWPRIRGELNDLIESAR